MKKIIFIGILLFGLMITSIGNISLADDIEEEEIEVEEIQKEVIETAAKAVQEPKLNARAAIVLDRMTRKSIV